MLSLDTDKIILWLQNHFVALLSSFVLFVCMGLGFIFFDKWSHSQEIKAKNQLSSFQKSLQDLMEEPEQKDPFDLKDLILTDEMKAQASLYKKAIEDNKKYKISVSFAIDLADFYYRYGEKTTAIELLSQFAKPTEKETLNQLASFQLASYYMNDKNCEQALSLFEKLLSNPFAEGFSPEARLQTGVCLEHLNRYQEAIKEYDRVAIENPDTYLGRQAKDYKQLLILKQKLNKENSKDKEKN